MYCDMYGNCYNSWAWGFWFLFFLLIPLCLFIYCVARIRNLRRMRGGDPPFRYTGWTVPMYSRQRWDPENNWRPTEQNSYYNGPTQKGRPNEPQQIPPYFDASHAEPEEYKPPAYPAAAQIR